MLWPWFKKKIIERRLEDIAPKFCIVINSGCWDYAAFYFHSFKGGFIFHFLFYNCFTKNVNYCYDQQVIIKLRELCVNEFENTYLKSGISNLILLRKRIEYWWVSCSDRADSPHSSIYQTILKMIAFWSRLF